MKSASLQTCFHVASEEIILTTPYFVPDVAMETAMLAGHVFFVASVPMFRWDRVAVSKRYQRLMAYMLFFVFLLCILYAGHIVG